MQIVHVKYGGEWGWRPKGRVRRALSPESTGVPFTYWCGIGESLSLIRKRVFTEAHAALQRLRESLCWSTPLRSLLPAPCLVSSLHSMEAMSCFIHQDASPLAVPNPSLRRGSSANFNTLSRSWREFFTCYVWIYVTGRWMDSDQPWLFWKACLAVGFFVCLFF